jgi:GNAT superfamily N-acetyltransferase
VVRIFIGLLLGFILGVAGAIHVLSSGRGNLQIMTSPQVHQLEEQVKQGDLYFLIRNENGEKAGFLSVDLRPQELFLSKLYLLKNQRGKGLARQALDFIRELAKEKGLKRITLTVHKRNPSVKIYQVLGFHILGPVMTDIGNGHVMDDYQMAMEINAR